MSKSQATATSLPPDIRKTLSTVSFRTVVLGVAEGIFLIFLYAGTMLLLRPFADRWLDFPLSMRILLLAFDLAVVGFLVWRFPIRAFLSRPGLEQAALKIESRYPELNTALITAVQYAIRPKDCASCPQSWLLPITKTVQKRLAAVDGSTVVSAKPLRHLAIACVIVLLLLAAAFWMWGPATARILVARHLGFKVSLPTRSTVEAITGNLTVERGDSVNLEARAVGLIPQSGIVELHGADGEIRKYPVAPTSEDPSRFRLTLQNVQQDFQYRFILGDGLGNLYRVTCESGPMIVQMRVKADPPSYLNMPPVQGSPSGMTVPEGSRVVIELDASQPLREAVWTPDAEDSAPVPMQIDPAQPNHARTEFTALDRTLRGFTIPLRSKEGKASQEDTFFRFQIVPDTPPDVRLLQPESLSESMTPESKIEIVYSVTDDHGVTSINLCFVEAGFEVSPDSLPSGAEVRRVPLGVPSPGVPTGVRWFPGRETPQLAMGSTVTFWIEATDGNTATGPGIGHSESLSFRLVSKEQKLEEIEKRFRELSGGVERLKERQDEAAGEVGRIIGVESKPANANP